MSAAVEIEPQMLTWAIARAGHDVESFIAEEPRVQYWLDGSKQPTLRQLEKFSKKVHVPFGYLFLDSPPEESLPIPFFRSETGRVRNVHINVYDPIEIMDAYAQVCAWAASMSHHYTQSALNEFLDADEADAFLAAFVLKKPDTRIVVTQEISQPERKSKIKIPDACVDLNIRYVDTITMFRELGERF